MSRLTRRERNLLWVLVGVIVFAPFASWALNPAVGANGIDWTATNTDVCPAGSHVCTRANATRQLLTKQDGNTYYNVYVSPSPSTNAYVATWDNTNKHWYAAAGGGGGMSIGGAVSGGLPGSVLYVDGSSNLAQDNLNLNYIGGQLSVNGPVAGTSLKILATGSAQLTTTTTHADTWAFPDCAAGTCVPVAAALTQTLTNKTLTAPVINGATSSGSTAVDFSGNSGNFKTSTGTITIGGTSNAVNAAVPITFTGTTALATATWNACSFQNSWDNYGSGQANCEYMKDAAGIVHIHGSVHSGTCGAIIFQLPAGYRGKTGITDQTTYPAVAYVDINHSTGNVIMGCSTNTFDTLDGVSFPAEQ
jgi:hypothetical protein